MDGESETESPPKSAQKSESRPARKRTLGSKSAFLNAQEGAQTSGVAQKSAPMRTFTQKRAHICAYGSVSAGREKWPFTKKSDNTIY